MRKLPRPLPVSGMITPEQVIRGRRELDENYVCEILSAAGERASMNHEQFFIFTLPDIAGGYHAEVAEAERRYFAGSGE